MSVFRRAEIGSVMFMNYYDKKGTDVPKTVLLLRFLIGILCGGAVFCALMSIFALILSFTRLTDSFMPRFAGLSVALGSFFGGFLTAKLIGRNGLRNGLVCGAVYALIHILFCVILTGLGNVGALVFVFFAVELCASALGGIFGVNSAK